MGVQPEQPVNPADAAWQSTLYSPNASLPAASDANAGEKRLAHLASFELRQDRMGDMAAALPAVDKDGRAIESKPLLKGKRYRCD